MLCKTLGLSLYCPTMSTREFFKPAAEGVPCGVPPVSAGRAANAPGAVPVVGLPLRTVANPAGPRVVVLVTPKVSLLVVVSRFDNSYPFAQTKSWSVTD